MQKKLWAIVLALVSTLLSTNNNALARDKVKENAVNDIRSIEATTLSIGNGSLQPEKPKNFESGYIMDEPQIVKIIDSYYLLTLPYRLETDETYNRVECRAVLRIADSADKAFDWKSMPKNYAEFAKISASFAKPKIICVYPTRKVLKVTYDRTNSLEEIFSPKWAGMEAGSIAAKQQLETTWDANLEHALGSFDNKIGQVQWEYLPAKSQHVPTGIMTAYAVLKVNEEQAKKLFVTPYEYCKTGWFAKDGVAAAPQQAVFCTESLMEFAQLRNAELDDATAAFIAGLQTTKLANGGSADKSSATSNSLNSIETRKIVGNK